MKGLKRIKVVGCKSDMYWYSNRVGEIFRIVDENKDYYIVVDSRKYVLKTDAEVVEYILPDPTLTVAEFIEGTKISLETRHSNFKFTNSFVTTIGAPKDCFILRFDMELAGFKYKKMDLIVVPSTFEIIDTIQSEVLISVVFPRKISPVYFPAII